MGAGEVNGAEGLEGLFFFLEEEGHPGWVLKDEWKLAEEGGGGLRGWRPGAFQAEGTACPEAQKRESLHRAVFGFVGAENVREERQR